MPEQTDKFTEGGDCACSEDVHTLRGRVDALERQIADFVKAFRKNDLGEPDINGHRQDHIQIARDDEVVAGYKQGVTKQLITLALGVLATLVMGGVWQAIKDHFSK